MRSPSKTQRESPRPVGQRAVPPWGERTPGARVDEGRFVLELLTSLRKHAWLVAACFLICVVAATAFALSRTKVYQANATIQIDPRPPRPLGHNVESVAEIGNGSWWSEQEYYNTQHKILASKRIAIAVVRELGLETDQAFIQNRPEPPQEKTNPLTTEEVATIVQQRTNVLPIKESRLLEVTYEDADPARATRVLDALIRAFMDNNLEIASDSAETAVEWLADQLESLRKELSDSELALHQYKLDKKITSVSLDDQTNTLQSELRQLVEARAKVRAEIQGATARLRQIQSVDPSDPATIPESELLRSPNLAPLQIEYQRILREKKALEGSGKGANYPAVRSAQAELETVREAIQRELKNIQAGAEKGVAALKHEEGGLTALVQGTEKKALELNLMQIEYGRLERTKINNEKLYGLVLERTKEAGLTKMLRVNNIRIIDAPLASKAPIKPRVPLVVAFGGLLGFALGILGAFARERLDRTIRTSDDLEERFGLPALGQVPLVGSSERRSRRAKRDQLEPHQEIWKDQRSLLAEDVRAIRTNLLFMSPDQPFKKLLVTSAGPGEGKTTVTACLGVAMAQAGHRVLIIDCDMRRPRIHTLFRTQVSPSTLTESLIKPSALNVESLQSDIPLVSILPAGLPPPNPAELLHSEAFKNLLNRLSEHFDILLLDTPPLIVTDAAIVATQVDTCLMVVRVHRTDRPQLARALRTLVDVGANVAGVVLNALDRQRAGYGYGAYGYGSYHPATRDDERQKAEGFQS